jgi:hypothetical protein
VIADPEDRIALACRVRGWCDEVIDRANAELGRSNQCDPTGTHDERVFVFDAEFVDVPPPRRGR